MHVFGRDGREYKVCSVLVLSSCSMCMHTSSTDRSGEQMEVGQRQCGVLQCRKNLMSQLVFFKKELQRDMVAVVASHFQSFNGILSGLNCFVLNRSNDTFQMFDGLPKDPAVGI